jgi:hypothetical protein
MQTAKTVRNRFRASSRGVTSTVSLGHSGSKANIHGAMTSHQALEDCGRQQGFCSVTDRLSSCRTPDMCFNQLRSHVPPPPGTISPFIFVSAIGDASNSIGSGTESDRSNRRRSELGGTDGASQSSDEITEVSTAPPVQD